MSLCKYDVISIYLTNLARTRPEECTWGLAGSGSMLCACTYANHDTLGDRRPPRSLRDYEE
eukprot:439005-Amorphochlora_amoeboformis.AAC.1